MINPNLLIYIVLLRYSKEYYISHEMSRNFLYTIRNLTNKEILTSFKVQPDNLSSNSYTMKKQ